LEVLYYEDIKLNHKISIGEYYVDKEEMIEFAKKWDARPFHIDEESAKSHPNGGLFVPLIYTMAIVWGRMSKVDTKPFKLTPARHSISEHKLPAIRIPV
jgi:acyl dehydratase